MGALVAWIPWLLGLAGKAKGPSIQSSVQEAAQQDLGKQAKLATADHAVMTQHMAAIAAAEVEAVAALRQKYQGGSAKPQAAGKKTDAMGNIIVCDDYRQNDPSPSKLLPLLAALGLGAGASLGGYLGIAAINKPTSVVAPSVVAPSVVAPVVQPATPAAPVSTNTTNNLGFTLKLIPPEEK